MEYIAPELLLEWSDAQELLLGRLRFAPDAGAAPLMILSVGQSNKRQSTARVYGDRQVHGVNRHLRVAASRTTR
jgi:hypothetical protein